MNSFDIQTISSLKYAVFPELVFQNISPQFLSSDAIKLKTLNLMADFVIQQQAKFSTKIISSCFKEASITASLKNQFIQLHKNVKYITLLFNND